MFSTCTLITTIYRSRHKPQPAHRTPPPLHKLKTLQDKIQEINMEKKQQLNKILFVSSHHFATKQPTKLRFALH